MKRPVEKDKLAWSVAEGGTLLVGVCLFIFE